MYKVMNDPNNIIVEEVPGFSWSGLCKIKSIDFKRYQYSCLNFEKGTILTWNTRENGAFYVRDDA